MADSSSRALLPPQGGFTKRGSARAGKRSTYKTPLYVLSLFGLLIACIALSVVVLITSHEDPVKSWKVQPSVWLSFLSGIYTILLGGLFVIGVAVTWWRDLAHGTTLKRLHFISAGARPNGFIPAFIAGGHARRVVCIALVVFLVKIAIGPSLQRATRPRGRDVQRKIDMNTHIAREIPDGWYGTWDHFDFPGVAEIPRTVLNTTISTIPDAGYSCPEDGECSALVYGAGLSHVCTSETRTFDMVNPESLNTTVFRIDTNMAYGFGPPMLHLIIEYVSTVDDSCNATVTTESCYLIPATIWYPITIRNTTLVMDSRSLIQHLTIVNNYTSTADIEPPNDANLESQPIGPLIGVDRGIGQVARTEATLQNEGKLSFAATKGAPHWPILYLDPLAKEKYPAACPIGFHSPTTDILAYFFEFMFRSAYSAASNTSDQDLQQFRATWTGVELRHITDFHWLAASVGIMILGTVAATILLWGWWQLGRYVTLSPLETGKAFGAPILLEGGLEQEVDSIIIESGHERVAHDGDELVWNGTVYTSSVNSAQASLRQTDAHSSGNRSVRGRGHRRGMSSISENGSGDIAPSFERVNFGVSTRRWDEEDEEADMGHYGRRRSGSLGRDTAPLIVTPGKNGAPVLPPIPPMMSSGSIRMEAFGPTERAQMGAASHSSGYVSPVAGNEGGMRSPKLKRQLSLIEEIARRTPE